MPNDNTTDFVEAMLQKAVPTTIEVSPAPGQEVGNFSRELIHRIVLKIPLLVAFGMVRHNGEFLENTMMNRAYCDEWIWEPERQVFTNGVALNVYSLIGWNPVDGFMLVDPDNQHMRAWAAGKKTIRLMKNGPQTVFPAGCFELHPLMIPKTAMKYEELVKLIEPETKTIYQRLDQPIVGLLPCGVVEDVSPNAVAIKVRRIEGPKDEKAKTSPE